MKETIKKIYSAVQKGLESEYAIPIFFVIALVFWTTNLTYVGVFLMAAFVALVLVVARDVKNIFIPIFYVSFFINDIDVDANLVLYGIAIGIVVLGIIGFLVKIFITKKATLKKGKMFWAFVVFTICLMLGGCIGHFNILAFGAVFAFCLLTYFIYFVAINCCDNLKNYLFKLAIYGAFAISIVMIILNAKTGNFFESIIDRDILWIGAQHINMAAIFVAMGIVGCFGLGYKNKYDWIFFALSFILLCALFLTFCRIMIAISVVAYIPMLVLAIVKSPKKLNYVWTSIGVIACVGIVVGVLWQPLSEICKTLIEKAQVGANGRDALWPWCWEKFKQNKVFGYGFISDEEVPSLRTVQDELSLVLAHNTPLQWLTSLGIVGTLPLLYYYYKKYQIVFVKYTSEKLFLIFAIVMIALSGFVDQAATMDIFVVMFTYVLLAACEKENQKFPEKSPKFDLFAKLKFVKTKQNKKKE